MTITIVTIQYMLISMCSFNRFVVIVGPHQRKAIPFLALLSCSNLEILQPADDDNYGSVDVGLNDRVQPGLLCFNVHVGVFLT